MQRYDLQQIRKSEILMKLNVERKTSKKLQAQHAAVSLV